jgi:WD40 repeat protein
MQACPLLRRLAGHEKGALSVAISGNSKIIASCSADKTIKLWNADSGDLLESFQPYYSDYAVDVDISPDGQLLASHDNRPGHATYDGTVRVWARQSGGEPPRQVHDLLGVNRGCAVVKFSPDGGKVASASHQHPPKPQSSPLVNVWNVHTGEQLMELDGPTNTVTCVAWSPDGNLLACGGHDKIIYVWDAITKELVNGLEFGHSESLTCLVFDSTAKLLFSSACDKTIAVWKSPKEVGAAEVIRRMEGHTDIVWSIALSPDDTSLVSGSRDMTVRLWDVTTGQQLKLLQGHAECVNCTVWSPDSQFILSASADCSVRMWRIDEQVRACMCV